MQPRIYIGADHGGFKLKNTLVKYMEQELNAQVIDLGAYGLDPKDDYPDIVVALKENQQQEDGFDPDQDRAILICSSGVGMCISANKLPGVRGVLVQEPETAFFARLHNNVNVLCLGGLKTDSQSIDKITDGDYANLLDAGMVDVSPRKAKRIVKIFLETETEATPGSRHHRRMNKINTLEDC